MVWSKWKGAAVLAGLGSIGLICASLVYSQQTPPRPSPSPSPAPAADPSQIITIQEAGKPPMECVILKTYRTADGQLAHDVRVKATGETMTFFDGNMPDAKAKPGVAPWNKGKPGAPAEYIQEHFVSGPDAVQATKAPPLAAATKAPAVEEFRTIQEMGKPALKCRVMAKWHTSDGSQALQMQALETSEILTIVEVGPAQAAPGSSAKAVATRIYHWGRNTTPPPGVPVPPRESPVALATPATGPSTSSITPNRAQAARSTEIGGSAAAAGHPGQGRQQEDIVACRQRSHILRQAGRGGVAAVAGGPEIADESPIQPACRHGAAASGAGGAGLGRR
jgi:hypothetical protein